MRSKVLLVANIFSTLWSVVLLSYSIWFLTNGGLDAFTSANYVADVFSEMTDSLNPVIMIDVILCLVLGHGLMFIIGTLLGWLGFGVKGVGLAKAAAVLYLLATIVFPIFVFICLPMIIFGFVGQSNQKKLNVRI